MGITLCVLLWPNEGRERELLAYEDKVLTLVPDHGGRVVQRFRTQPGSGPLTQPFEVHVIEFPSEASLDAYLTDDRRTTLAQSRDRAIARTEVLRVDPV